MHLKVPLDFARRVVANTWSCGLAALVALSGCEPAPEATAPVASSSPIASPDAASSSVPEGTPVMLPQAQLAAEYDTLTGLIAEARTADVWQKFRSEKQASIQVANNRLLVSATGDDPVLILPPFCAGRRFILQAVIDSPAETTAQLYYMTTGQMRYTAAQSQSVPMQKGRNVIYFRYDKGDIVDPLRFDPGSAPGLYTIESMTARALPPTAFR